jgi:type IV pilus assembly protein PilC
MAGSYLQTILFSLNRPEPLRQASLLMVLSAGIGDGETLTESLAAHASDCGSPWSDRIRGLGVLLEHGQTLSSALSTSPGLLPDTTMIAIRVAEQNGTLRDVLIDEATRLMQDHSAELGGTRNLPGTLLWLTMISTVSAGLVTFIMIFIIPKFKKIFEDFDTDLPAMTQTLIGVSDWMFNYWYFLFIAPIAFWLFIKIVKKNKTGAYVVDWCSLRIPLIGKILHIGTIARVTRTLGTLIASGVPILEGLIIARDTAGNAVFVRAFDNIYSAIREGETIAVPLKEARIVDDLVVNMVDVGEETGALDDMLYKVADVYDEEVEVRVESLVSLLEPIMVVVLGLIVGFIVIALFLPLIKLLNDLA